MFLSQVLAITFCLYSQHFEKVTFIGNSFFFSLSVRGSFTACQFRHLRPPSGRERTVITYPVMRIT